MAHLPWPVHLVAHAPVPDPPRLLSAIAAAPAGHGRVPEPVGVVHPAHGLVEVTRGIGEVGLRVVGLAPGQELIGDATVGVVFKHGLHTHNWSLVFATYAVLQLVV